MCSLITHVTVLKRVVESGYLTLPQAGRLLLRTTSLQITGMVVRLHKHGDDNDNDDKDNNKNNNTDAEELWRSLCALQWKSKERVTSIG